jgi:hypothetical protein
MTDHHRSPPSAPQGRRELRSRRFTIRKLDDMLKQYWHELVAENEPMAEAILERALKEAALRGTLFV